MVICGLKLTHDGAIALIDSGKLIFSYEIEKLANKPRYSAFSISLLEVEEIFREHGYTTSQVDHWVIDGWDNWNPVSNSTQNPAPDYYLQLKIDENRYHKINKLASYGHYVKKGEDIWKGEFLMSEDKKFQFTSYKHVTGHIAGAYCTSPFAKRSEDSYILVWDGGMPPQLFYKKGSDAKVLNLGDLFPLMGSIYIEFAHMFEPFNTYRKDLSIAGKVMAYIACGHKDTWILGKYREIYLNLIKPTVSLQMNEDICAIITSRFVKEVAKFQKFHQIDPRDILTTFHAFMQELLLEKLGEIVENHPNFAKNLCYSGGCALNIKWNSKIRESGIFERIWIPPFPNDSGSALGAACCEMVAKEGIHHLDWNVYKGPPVKNSFLQKNEFRVSACSIEELALLIYEQNEPIVMINGQAELGPRALGNRSILAPANNPKMKEILNDVKGRESYRPVAPICLEEDAPGVFEPGSPDPFMLFEHRVRGDWRERVPAICHLDNSARLQTVNESENEVIYALLKAYKKLSGIPLLCNTSANFKGKGFFPDVESVMNWGKVNFIWSEGLLFSKNFVLSVC